MFKTAACKISSVLGSNTKFMTIAAIIVTMACLVPTSLPEQKAYSQSNNYGTAHYFAVSVPDGWIRVQEAPYIHNVETVYASRYCPPEGCGEASLSLYAFLSTPGSFFPTGRTAQPKDVFQGIIDYNEGIGVHAIEMIPLKTPDPQVAVTVETIDDQGQRMTGMSFYLLSEQLGVLWERTFYAKEGSWDYYYPIFTQIQSALKPLYPTEVLCHENHTPQCWQRVSEMSRQSYCTTMNIINNIGPAGSSNFRTWDPYCQRYR